ncbi:MAG: IS21-like element helper ATPase IstB [Thermoanaerobaculia bacterium]
MSEPTFNRLVDHVEKLGLWRLKETLSSLLSVAEKESWGHAETLDRLFEEEIVAREERRVRSSLKLAGFPFLKTLDGFDFAFQPSLDRARVLDLASLGFLARKENVLLLGPPGVGKTHLAIALAVQACQNGYSVYFTTLDEMIRKLAAADRAGKLPQKLRTYSTKYQLLVVDEVGYLTLNRIEANYLFQVVASRYERSSMILTSNKAINEWPEVFGELALATAILDRILHHSYVLSIRGNSYRLRDKLLTTTQPASADQPA